MQTIPQVYLPPQKIIDKYADVLVNFALNSGQGVQSGEVVSCVVPDIAKPLALALQNTLLKAGAHPMVRLIPSGFEADFYRLATEDQLTFFPKKYLRARANLFDHQIGIIADVNPRELSEVDPQKIMTSRHAKKPYRDWLVEKETAGTFTWTLGLWGVEAKAEEVGLKLEEYWEQIIKACFLDKKDPIAEWRRVGQLQRKIKKTLNDLTIEYVHVVGPDVDLKVQIGATRQWKGGSGRNIPSFEIFTSPDWRGTEGWIRFNQPLYRYGNVVKDIYLRFEKGKVAEAKAKEGQKVLSEMLKTKDADKLGEFSLTDKRTSRITHVMAETLFDENIGGPFGNMHVAVGMSYKDCYNGDPRQVKPREWKKMGFNDSSVHTDMVTTTDRTVTAYLADGTQKVIYRDGMYVV